MVLAPVLIQRYFTAAGLPLVGGLLYSYLAGSSTPTPTYTDSTGGSSNTNPVVLDSTGSHQVWLAPSINYKFILKDSAGNIQFTVDHVTPPSGGGSGLTQTSYAITNGMSPTPLVGQSFDSTVYTSAVLWVEILRGTQLIANTQVCCQWDANLALWKAYEGPGAVNNGNLHGVTWSMTTTTTVGTLDAATDSVYGTGTIKIIQAVLYAA